MIYRILIKHMSKQFSKIANLNIMALTRSMSSNICQQYPSIKELQQNLAKTVGVESGYSPIAKDRSHLLKYLPKSQDELPKRSMQDSFLAGIIPLSEDRVLQDKYVTFLGQVRIGRLLEDMDMFAVMVAYKHISNPKLPKDEESPYTIVTALVDKIDFTDFIPKPHEDIKISGHVSWVGNSSMEVSVWLEQLSYGTWHRITRALFLMAARDSNNNCAAIVNAIEPANEREKKILSGGETRKQMRVLTQKKHVARVIPDDEEQKIIHDLYLRSISNNTNSRNTNLPPGCVWMSDRTLSNVIFSHPEQRNIHNKVFGGFIMLQALELSWVLGYTFCKYRPVLRSISDINFQRPIAVNSLIQMHAHVVYTQMNYIQVTTYVETYNPVTGKNDTTNTFHFTFEAPEIVNECIPMTYHEAMMYIDGRRHFLEVMKESPGGRFPSKL